MQRGNRESSQIFKRKHFAKTFHLRCFTGHLICLCSDTLQWYCSILRSNEKQSSMYEQTWTQDVNSTYIRLSEDIQDVFWTSYVRSIYVQCLRGVPLSCWWLCLLVYLQCNTEIAKTLEDLKGKLKTKNILFKHLLILRIFFMLLLCNLFLQYLLRTPFYYENFETLPCRFF